jgi:hypothetical protein
MRLRQGERITFTTSTMFTWFDHVVPVAMKFRPDDVQLLEFLVANRDTGFVAA